MCENTHFEFFCVINLKSQGTGIVWRILFSYLLFPGPNTPELQALCLKAGSSAVDRAKPKS